MSLEASFSFSKEQQSFSESLLNTPPDGKKHGHPGTTCDGCGGNASSCCCEDAASLASDSFSSYSNRQAQGQRTLAWQDDESSALRRPIVVGYAFSEKKMSTMGVVMAEASRTKLRYFQQDEEESNGEENDERQQQHHETEEALMMPPAEVPCCFRENPLADRVVFSLQSGGYHISPHALTSDIAPGGISRAEITFTTTAATTTTTTTTTTPLDHVVRFFRSSCSSIPDDYSETLSNKSIRSSCSSTVYTNATMLTIPSTTAATSSYGGQHHRHSCAAVSSSGASAATRASASSFQATTRHQHSSPSARRLPAGNCSPPIHIAFVPIDPDQPVEEQHGGRMDVILHKLTEDILSLSQLPRQPSPMQPPLVLDASQRAAARRIGNLRGFASGTGCCLLDDPVRVQALMRRDTISSHLSEALRGVTSRSGVPVSTPRWTVLTASAASSLGSAASPVSECLLDRQVRAAGLRYPLIVKPLIAAGASASHAMAVAMTPRGLVDLASTRRLGLGEGDGGRSRSFLCQEYSNHDEALYKVYVLGSHVSVHKRRSLPNLPAAPAVSSSLEQERARQPLGIMPGPRLKDLVEFDSQRPYPRFSDFLDAVSGNRANPEGDVYAPGMNRPHVAPLESFPQRLLPPVSSPQQGWAVTAEEVGPVVDVLRTAFGLDLFGFDVLVATTRLQPEACEWLVVDVNYFPSYKEVSNFPSLLARYLTQRALQERTRKLQSLALQRQVQDAGDGEHPEPR